MECFNVINEEDRVFLSMIGHLISTKIKTLQQRTSFKILPVEVLEYWDNLELNKNENDMMMIEEEEEEREVQSTLFKIGHLITPSKTFRSSMNCVCPKNFFPLTTTETIHYLWFCPSLGDSPLLEHWDNLEPANAHTYLPIKPHHDAVLVHTNATPQKLWTPSIIAIHQLINAYRTMFISAATTPWSLEESLLNEYAEVLSTPFNPRIILDGIVPYITIQKFIPFDRFLLFD